CIASFALGEVIEGIAVLIIVVLNISIAVYTEKSANDSLAALAEMSAPTCTVVRDGEATSLDSRLLVPGDILRLSMGDVVPADVRLISGVDVKTNEMPLTGESADVAKRAVDLPPSAAGSTTLTPENKLFSATTVTSGSGVGVVVATGMHTRVGQIAALLAGGEGPEGQEAPGCCAGLQGHAQRTPLQERLHRLGIYISICALLGCVLVFLIGLWRGYRDPEHPGNPPAVQLVLVSVSLAVSAVPEGLPLCVTITLAVGTSVMARVHNTLIRQLPAVESLGSVQVVCSDKTGTLTEGKMTAVKAWLPAASGAGTEVNIGPGKSLISGGGCSFTTTQGTTLLSRDPSMPADAAEASASKAAQLVSLLRSTLLNCTAQLEVQAAGQEEPHPLEEADVQELEHEVHAPPSFSVSGNATEAPLVKAAAKAGLFSYAVGAEFPPLHPTESGAEARVEVPFTSARKLMMQVVRVPEGVTTFGGVTLPADTAFLALVKGAPNYVLDLALRVIAVAACPLTSLPYTDEEQDTEAKLAALKGAGNWCLNGLLASIDPEREGVQEAIATAATAGVRTVMITGDYRATAVAIAKNIGLLAPTDDTDEAATDCSAL
ncbi:yoaB, partial [Symbiodinium sp. KB8]